MLRCILLLGNALLVVGELHRFALDAGVQSWYGGKPLDALAQLWQSDADRSTLLWSGAQPPLCLTNCLTKKNTTHCLKTWLVSFERVVFCDVGVCFPNCEPRPRVFLRTADGCWSWPFFFSAELVACRFRRGRVTCTKWRGDAQECPLVRLGRETR